MPDGNITFQVTGADGKATEVAVPASAVLDAVKDTHVPKDRIEADLNRRVQSVLKNGGYRKQEELLDDEEFAGKIAEKHGFTKGAATNDGDAAKQLKDAVARALADVDTKTVKPLTEKLAAKEKRENELLVRDRERQILQAAADAGIKKAMMKALAKGRAAPIVAMLEDTFEYDQESGEYYVSKGDGEFVLSTSKDADQTYQTISEFVAGWAADPANADFVDPTGQKGAGVSGGGKGARGAVGEIVLTHDEAQNGGYEAALKKVGGDHTKVRVRQQEGF